MSNSATNIDYSRNEHETKATKTKYFQEEILLQPYTYITQITPKDTWRKLSRAFNYWLNVPEDKYKIIDECYQKFYYVGLLIDDLRDNALVRGNKQTSQVVYGIPCTLNALNYANLLATVKLISLNHPQALMLYIKQAEDVYAARWLEANWRDAVICPTEDEYYEMIIKRTCDLFTMQIKFMQLFSTNQTNFRKLSAILGLYCFILDDYQQFISADESESQIYREDVTLARFSLPIIHAVQKGGAESEKIIDILRLRTKEKQLKEYVVSLLEKSDSFEYTEKILGQLREEALLEIKRIGKNSLMENFINNYFNIPLDTHTPKNEVSCYTIEDRVTDKIFSCINGMDNIESMEKVVNDIELKIKEAKGLLKPYQHSRSVTSKSTSITLIMMLNKSLKIPKDKLTPIIEILRYVHYGCAMYDDMQDYSPLRRGIPASHFIYGIENTVYSVFYLQLMALQQVIELNHPQALDTFFEAQLQMCRGQGIELYWRDNSLCPTEEEYLQMTADKTGGISSMLIKLMALFSKTNLNVEQLSAIMGQYFQVNDDYQNVKNNKYFNAKGFCEDITEGKFSFLAIHAIRNNPKEGKILIDILHQRTNSIELKKYFQTLLEKCGSFEYTKNKEKELKNKLFGEFSKLEAGQLMKDFIEHNFALQ